MSATTMCSRGTPLTINYFFSVSRRLYIEFLARFVLREIHADRISVTANVINKIEYFVLFTRPAE